MRSWRERTEMHAILNPLSKHRTIAFAIVWACSCTGGMAPDGEGPCNDAELVDAVRAQLAARDLAPLEAPEIRPELVALGEALFYDKILSGGRDVSCATCHNPALGLTDRLTLNSGVKGEGVGPDRTGGQVGGRHTQTLFNMHLVENLTIDGKVEEVDGNVIGLGLPVILPKYQAPFEDFAGVLAPHVVAGQAMLPEVTFSEMLGIPGTDENNEILLCLDPEAALADIFGCMFDGYMARLREIPGYVQLFEAAYPGVSIADMNFGHAGNAIAAYELVAFASVDSPWDRFIAGDDCALDDQELQGAAIFFDEKRGNCASCHAGAAFTDSDFHNTLAPNFGCGNDLPGRNGANGYDDFGRPRNDYAEAWVLDGQGDEAFPVEERYRWRTAPLRNVEYTAPYGRLGQYATLEAFVSHYIDPETSLNEYDITQLSNATFVDYTTFMCSYDSLHDSLLGNSAEVIAAGPDPQLAEVEIDAAEDVGHLAAFLRALSEDALRPEELAKISPATVPSGLSVDLSEPMY
ncbi:MAG TPA: hypothetical protein ENK31_02930 [Nannocystis exedens]|nr:hypothetical protein [Nannocystis exedens]